MGIWDDKMATPRYRKEPLIDDGDHLLMEYPDCYSLACLWETREMEFNGNRPDYCPYCGEEL